MKRMKGGEKVGILVTYVSCRLSKCDALGWMDGSVEHGLDTPLDRLTNTTCEVVLCQQ